jgi:hypothetical protein
MDHNQIVAYVFWLIIGYVILPHGSTYMNIHRLLSFFCYFMFFDLVQNLSIVYLKHLYTL